MPNLTIRQGDRLLQAQFSGTPILAEVLAGMGLAMPHPCGGRGTCFKCAVEAEGAVSEPNEAEARAGARLSCQMRLVGDCTVALPRQRAMEIETSSGAIRRGAAMPGRRGAAVDIGTTTLALRAYDLASGAPLHGAGAPNPQASVAADVMGRIGAALRGEGGRLQRDILGALEPLIGDGIETLVLTGNTTMLYLLTGRNPARLSAAPFEADHLFDEWIEVLGRRAYLPPCMNAFVGADITCAVLASGLCARKEISLLCDIGTNGELALWKENVLYVTSTAAGPAFEGAGISCGCGSVRGAIDRVWVENGRLGAHSIGDAPAVGLCGSGLIDAIAALLQLAEIDETGATEEASFPLSDGVALLPRDVRAVQLAKAAIAAGILTLLESADVRLDEVRTLHIAGGFGSHLNVGSAADIGLIPRELASRARVIGNAALKGAEGMLLDQALLEEARWIAGCSRHVNLGGNPRFNEQYMEQMLFPEGE
ncbi:MAG: DUF4445 domain-containing protein [Clostridiales bacterium]|nr:DUF4445 domain-containing protein [Clostridiales bacterium]